MKIVTSKQMSTLEQSSSELGVSTLDLMQNAAHAVATLIKQDISPSISEKITVLVGPGNNGSDGLLIAGLLHKWGASVTVYITRGRPNNDLLLKKISDEHIKCVFGPNDPDYANLRNLVTESGLLVDCILGANQNYRPLDENISSICTIINERSNSPSYTKCLSVDIPTGIYPDTGEVDPATIRADITTALGFPKLGLFTFPGNEYIGELHTLDIGLPNNLPLTSDINLELLTSEYISTLLPKRSRNSHKGTYGHALLVGGSQSYIGAPSLSSLAAMRAGSGLITIATPQSIYPIVANNVIEAIHLPLSEDEYGNISAQSAPHIINNIDKYDVLAIGPGLNQSPNTREFLFSLLESLTDIDIPLIIDADGLNNLSLIPEWWTLLTSPTILTPHPGELSTLTGKSVPDIQNNRLELSQEYSQKWGVTLVLKGALTVTSTAAGNSYISPFTNSSLATAGTGDVLTGIIAGLMAQGIESCQAALCGVYIHAYAGELGSNYFGASGMIASDLITYIPDAMRHIRLDLRDEADSGILYDLQ
ncbi:MAG: NAD(P)H-hydrate dehydratase [Dehalococcoidia bacterium]|nr:NAD(P)H-hydrate dehydratase [Dehalococcoidia bacterium]